MAKRGDLERWLEDTEWVADFDFAVSPDAVRCRPDPLPYHHEPLAVRLCLPGPAPEPRALPVRRQSPEVAALWESVGRGYRELTEATPN